MSVRTMVFGLVAALAACGSAADVQEGSASAGSSGGGEAAPTVASCTPSGIYVHEPQLSGPYFSYVSIGEHERGLCVHHDGRVNARIVAPVDGGAFEVLFRSPPPGSGDERAPLEPAMGEPAPPPDPAACPSVFAPTGTDHTFAAGEPRGYRCAFDGGCEVLECELASGGAFRLRKVPLQRYHPRLLYALATSAPATPASAMMEVDLGHADWRREVESTGLQIGTVAGDVVTVRGTLGQVIRAGGLPSVVRIEGGSPMHLDSGGSTDVE